VYSQSFTARPKPCPDMRAVARPAVVEIAKLSVLTRAKAHHCRRKRSRGFKNPLPRTEVWGWHSFIVLQLTWCRVRSAFFSGTYYADSRRWLGYSDAAKFFWRILRCTDIFASARVCRLPPLASIFWELRSGNSATCMYYLCFSALGSLFVSSSAHDFVIASYGSVRWVAALCDI
jgi:hypothetical protein